MKKKIDRGQPLLGKLEQNVVVLFRDFFVFLVFVTNLKNVSPAMSGVCKRGTRKKKKMKNACFDFFCNLSNDKC